jgi:hypothetical protein
MRVPETKILKALSAIEDKTAELTVEQFEQEGANQDRFFIVSWAGRPGAQTFMTKLEYEHFTPGGPLNVEYEFYAVLWQDIPFHVCSIPMSKRALAEKVAKETHMRIADGYPNLLGGGQQLRFPIHGNNVWSLENEADSPVYKGQGAKMAEVEVVEVDALQDRMKDALRTRN